jgi:hypothetical protein
MVLFELMIMISFLFLTQIVDYKYVITTEDPFDSDFLCVSIELI